MLGLVVSPPAPGPVGTSGTIGAIVSTGCASATPNTSVSVPVVFTSSAEARLACVRATVDTARAANSWCFFVIECLLFYLI